MAKDRITVITGYIADMQTTFDASPLLIAKNKIKPPMPPRKPPKTA